jgi:hypothetical protein
MTHLGIGQVLSSIALEDVIESKTYNLAQIFGDDKVLVIFVDNHCAYVSHYSKRIEALAAYAYANDLKVVYINPHQQKIPSENTIDQMQRFFRQSNWKGRYFSDPEQQLVRILKANKLPEVFIVQVLNSKVNILFKGPIDDNPQNDKYVGKRYTMDAIDQIKIQGSVKSKGVMNNMGCRILRF